MKPPTRFHVGEHVITPLGRGRIIDLSDERTIGQGVDYRVWAPQPDDKWAEQWWAEERLEKAK